MKNEQLVKAHHEGKEAYKKNVCISRCPYPMMNGKVTPIRAAWFKGYNSEKNAE